MTPLSLDFVPPRLEFMEYIRKPQVICRIIILVLAIIIVGVVRNDCQIYGKCLFGDDVSACGYALFLGSVTMVVCIAFMILDLWVDNIPNTNARRTVTLVDFVVVGCSTFLWFVGFCLLCNRWQNTSETFLRENDVSSTGPRVAIAFTFFSFLALGAPRSYGSLDSVFSVIDGKNTSETFLRENDVSSTGPRVAIAFTFFSFLALGVLLYWVHLAYTAVRFLTPGTIPNDQNNFSAYADPSTHTYHGFTRDAEMLDPTQATHLDSDMSSYDHGKSGRAFVPQSTGGVFTGNLVEAYQP
ncbi:hypothetical protein FGIG_04360 [Fasciola gigantica]|uniref:MARVEL domain-containing protein n=1 Tax=Fasciola gigantica TaxID=46835 RepID=A0A504YET6_FASGI|nr:hypothetical protein FGIG_04360 [Fasciola gigantica]